MRKFWIGLMTIVGCLSLFVEMDVSTIPHWVFIAFKITGLTMFILGLIALGANDNDLTNKLK